MKKSLDAQEETNWEPRVPEVPATWVQVEFEAAFVPISVNKRKVPAKTYLPAGALPIVDQGQAFIGGYTNDLSLVIDPGDGVIVFGDHTRTFKRVDFPFAAGADGIKVLHPVLTDSRYAYYACLSLQFPNKGYSRHYSYLNRSTFPIAPVSERERIVSKIDELFSEIEEGERALERAQKLVERYRQSVLKAAVTGELTREWREKHKGKLESGEALLARILKARREAWETSELEKMKAKGQKPPNTLWKTNYSLASEPKLGLADEMPDGWAQLSLEQCTLAKRPIAYGVLQPGEDQADGVLLIRVCDIADGVVDQGNLKRISPAISEMFPRTQLQGGEVLLTLVGTIGRTAIVPPNLAGANVARAVGVLTPGNGILGEWLEICLRYSKTRQSMTENAREVARKTLNLEQVREHAVPIPSDAEQREAVSLVNELLSKCIELEREITGQIRVSRALRQSILKSAFSGQLTPQDPTDEPASVLLERITVERNQQKTKAAPKTARRKKVTA